MARRAASWLLVALLASYGCTSDTVSSASGGDASSDIDVSGVGGVDGTGTADVPGVDVPLSLDVTAPDATADANDSSEPGPGEPGYTCTSGNQCTSGWCVEGPDGKECAASCGTEDSCPTGWVCSQVATHPDLTFVCVFAMPNLCKPCAADADCGGLYGEEGGVCTSAGEQAGSFCAYPCKGSVQCPAGYSCGGPGGGTLCWPDGDACACEERFEGLSTPCSVTTELGTCGGKRTCQGGAYGECSASEPAVEACNGADDDCDGETDEGLGGDACDLVNADGTCPGTTACEGGEIVCDGLGAEAELCDGLDQNCDGVADEGFDDLDQDGIADCVDTDKDGDGIEDTDDNCPLDANTEQEDLDIDGKGDACDPDADGDQSANEVDCAPLDPSIHPDATEACNGKDDDCDGETDEGMADLDADGIADCVDPDMDGDEVANEVDNCPLTPNAGQEDTDGDGKGDACETDADGDGDPDLTDCAWLDATIHHGAQEICDGVDQNCNSFADEGFIDSDGDGEADCVDPDDDNDGAFDEGDCAPLDPTVFPGAAEACNGVDDDCDEAIDEDFTDTDADGMADCVDTDDDGDGVLDTKDVCPLVPDPGQADLDGDGKGDACDDDLDGDKDPNAIDCAPADPKIHHAAVESCNGIDDDCDGAVDDGYSDLDQDGIADCMDDDDDGDGVLDGADNCPVTPNGDQLDTDGDGKGDACEDDSDGDGDPNLTDCAKLDATIHHAAQELCDGIDQNCNAIADEGFADTDKDGTADCIDADDDGDGFDDGEDCAPTNPLVFPGAKELCNGADDDCDGTPDNGFIDTDEDGQADCVDPDDDGDGVLDAADNCPLLSNPAQADLDKDGLGDACDADKDGDKDPDETDCEPLNPKIHHEAYETCNGTDDNCDGTADEGYSDLDKDGIADCMDDDDDGDGVLDTADNCPVTANAGQEDLDKDGIGDACEVDKDGDGDPDLTDCAETDPLVFHGAAELCDGKDQNCNAIADEGFADTDKDGTADCVDTDDDGDGRPDDEDNCPLVANKTQTDTDKDGEGDACDIDDDDDGELDESDCGPLDATVHHGATEVCNGKDDDCNGLLDEADATGCSVYFYNKDGDGFGIDILTKCLCTPEAPFTAEVPGDCNDQNAQVFPGANEYCNGKDDDCDDLLDEQDALGCTAFYEDADQDGWGGAKTACLCAAKQGYASKTGDCDDLDALAHPGALETCNGVDDDCDGTVDEAGANGCEKLYADKDGDGWGITTDSKCLCGPEGTYSAPADGDCADADAEIYPGHTESCDGKDNNCNGQVDEGVKSTFYIDNDSDGFGASYNSKEACEAPAGYVSGGGDCNDFNGEISPAAPEACDDIDNNCNGQKDEGLPLLTIYKDVDGDGFALATATPEKKCNVPTGYTGAQDYDGDGKKDWDCDDTDGNVHPGGSEICDGKDNDCDTVTDNYCPTMCPGTWPFKAQDDGSVIATVADMDQDGFMEVVAGGSTHVTIANFQGAILYKEVGSTYNTARGGATFADVDGKFYTSKFSLEAITGKSSKLSIYKMDPVTKAITKHGGTDDVYDASRFLAHDIDGDGSIEVVATTWAEMDRIIRIFRFDKALDAPVLVVDIPAPDGTPIYTDGMLLVDLDGDGVMELVFGTGYGKQETPNTWSGKLWAYSFEPGTLAFTPHCLSCFATDLPDLFGGSVGNLFAADWDADGSPEIAADVSYFLTNDPGVPNTSQSYRWMFSAAGDPWPDYPSMPSGQLFWDTDGDTQPDPTSSRLYDMNGDGYGDRFAVGGGKLVVQLWDPVGGKFVGQPSQAAFAESTAVEWAGNLDGDSRLDVLVSHSPSGTVSCYRIGDKTLNQDSFMIYPEIIERTYQYDNWEPNDAIERAARIYHDSRPVSGMLSSPTDVDNYLSYGPYSKQACVTVPAGVKATLSVYSTNVDLDGDGQWDLINPPVTVTKTGCVNSSKFGYQGKGWFRFEVKSADGSYNQWRPYAITFK